MDEREKQQYQKLKQQVLPFDFWEEERKEEEDRRNQIVENLPHFQNPTNDNEYLLECQWKYKHGDRNQLIQIYNKSRLISMKFINTISKKNKHVRALSLEQKKIKAEDAATSVIEQYMKKPDFVITKNFPGYLFLRVIHELFYQRNVDRIVDYVDIDRFFREGDDDGLNSKGELFQMEREIIHYEYKEEETEEEKELKEMKQFYLWKKQKQKE